MQTTNDIVQKLWNLCSLLYADASTTLRQPKTLAELVKHIDGLQWYTRSLRQQGCGDELEGTLVPDVVIHSGNPLEALAVYDFKFPCPISNSPRWNHYPEGPPHNGASQGDVYQEALGVKPLLVAPKYGIHP